MDWRKGVRALALVSVLVFLGLRFSSASAQTVQTAQYVALGLIVCSILVRLFFRDNAPPPPPMPRD